MTDKLRFAFDDSENDREKKRDNATENIFFSILK